MSSPARYPMPGPEYDGRLAELYDEWFGENPDAVDPLNDQEELAEFEAARQARIAAGEETACAVCGCSDSRACPGGCVWATTSLCSRCA